MLERYLILLISLIALSACGSKPSSVPNVGATPAQPTTGYGKEVDGKKTLYTISGNPEVYSELRAEFEGKSPAMARSIDEVNVKKMNDGQYEIRVKFNGKYFGLKELFFEGGLTTVGSEKYAQLKEPQITPDTYKPNFILDLRCRSLDCKMIEMKLHERTGAYLRSEAFWIYQERETNARFIESESGGIENLKVKSQDTLSVQTSVVIVQGPSYSEVVVKSRSAKPDEEPILKVRTDLVDTQARAEKVQSISVRGIDTNISAELQGNDPVTGDLMLDLSTDAGENSVRVIVAGPQNERALHGIKTNRNGSIIDPSGLSDEIDLYTQKFDEFANNPEVKERIELLLSEKGGKACAHNHCKHLSRSLTVGVLTRMQAIVPQLMEAADYTGVSPENAYLLGIESRFLKKNNYPIEGNNGSSASGPWQILDGTAKHIIKALDLPYKYYKTWDRDTKTRYKIKADDDRRFVLESSIMGLGYFSTFKKSIRSQPGLAFLSYTLGPTGAKNRLVSRHGTYIENGLSFNDLVRLNSFDDTDVKADYVHSIIALRFIGMNPSSYGLDIEEMTAVPEKLLPILRNPKR